jgi:hypothetical protein
MIGKDSIETTAAQVTAELLQLGFGPDERVTIIIEAVEGVATTRQKSQGALLSPGVPTVTAAERSSSRT